MSIEDNIKRIADSLERIETKLGAPVVVNRTAGADLIHAAAAKTSAQMSASVAAAQADPSDDPFNTGEDSLPAPTSAPTPAPAKRGRPAATPAQKPAPAAVTITDVSDLVRELIGKKDPSKGKLKALEILNSFGAGRVSELSADKYAACQAELKKALAE